LLRIVKDINPFAFCFLLAWGVGASKEQRAKSKEQRAKQEIERQANKTR
jgi:hypothetical protein